MVTSQRLGRIYSQNSDFLEIHLIFFKTALFFARSALLVHGRDQLPLQPPAPLLAARRAQRVQEKLHSKWSPRTIARLD